MKQNLTEVARFQKLAGIQTNENELYEDIEDSFIKAFGEKGLDALEAGKEGGEKTEPGKEQQNEAILGLVFTFVSLLPWLSQLSGDAANAIKRSFTVYSGEKQLKLSDLKKKLADLNKKKTELDKQNRHEEENEVVEKIQKIEKIIDQEFGSKLGNWLKKFGEDLHHAYVKPFKKGLDWLASKLPENPKNLTLKRLKEDERFRENLASIGYCITSILISGGLMYLEGAYAAANAAKMAHATGLSTNVVTYIAKGIKAGKKSKEIWKSAAEMI